MNENWKYLVKKYDEATRELGEVKRELSMVKYTLARVREHRAEFSLSSPIEWVQDLDKIFEKLFKSGELNDYDGPL